MTRRTVPALALLVLVGSAAPAQAYRIKRTGEDHTVRWDRPVVRLQVHPRVGALLPGDDAEQALQIAVDAWQGLPGLPRIVVEDGAPAPIGYEGGPPTNGVYVPRPWPFESHRLAVTVSSYDERGRLLDVDVLLNRAHPFALLDEHEAPPRGPSRAGGGGQQEIQYDLANILTHELGHVLGLDESPDDPHATMWPHIERGEVHKRVLASDDEQGVTALYEDAGVAAGGCQGATVAGPPPRRAGAWAATGLAIALLRRRRR